MPLDAAPFTRFRDVIVAATQSEIHDDVTLQGRLTLARDGDTEMSYAPFEHITPHAKVAIVGITPGRQQASNALMEARRLVLTGADDATTVAAAKAHAAFSGGIRTGLVGMLDHVGLHEKLGIPTCDRLWDSHGHLAHFTSALRYPVFRCSENFNSNPVARRPGFLRDCVESCLAEEVVALPDALWIPCGGKPAAALNWLVRRGLLDPERVCLGMLHPSPSNNERVYYFLGIGRDRTSLSGKTNPDLIDRAKATMIARIERFTVGLEPKPPGAAVLAAPPAAQVAATATTSKPRKASRREPSKLGREIHDAIAADARFVRHQDDRLYHRTYRTVGRSVFAFERISPNAITIWLPATAEVEAAAVSAGILVPARSLPFPNPDKPSQYGRLSTLANVPELRDAVLLPVKVTSGRQALAVLAALP